jgi:hypothetical protein
MPDSPTEIKPPQASAALMNGVLLNKEAPETFKIPSDKERRSAEIGDYVKIGLESEAMGGERFWVEITAKRDDGHYIGRIDNDLEDGWGVNCDDLIVFGPDNVLSTY